MSAVPGRQVELMLFDLDDTLYPQSSGFSDHRNHEVAVDFMVERLGFESRDEATRVRNEYFRKYHSTLKGLSVASAEGLLPGGRKFVDADLGAYFAERCDFSILKPNATLAADLAALPVRKMIFTNGPRAYGLKALKALGLEAVFPDDAVVGVEDVMPACKPEPAAFLKVLDIAGVTPDKAVMVEDSMKNIRACKDLGLMTVLVDESIVRGAAGGEAALLADIAQADDPAVDIALPSADYLRTALPGLWQSPSLFSTTTSSS